MTGNFENIESFETLIEQAFDIIRHNIRHSSYDEKRVEVLEKIIKQFFDKHLFVIEDQVIRNIRETLSERIQEALKKKVPHGQRPLSAYFRKLFAQNKELDKKALADARAVLELHKDEEMLKNQIYNMLMVLVREEGLMTSSLELHEKRLSEALDHFIAIIAQEYRALYDLEVNETLEEADLMLEIDVVLQHNIPKAHAKKLKEIKKKIKNFVSREIQKLKKDTTRN